MVNLGTLTFERLLETLFAELFVGVTDAIMPIPWNVLKPSIVRTLWPTLLAINWINAPSSRLSIPLNAAALRSNLLTSVYDDELLPQ